jgi:hypothetical protein
MSHLLVIEPRAKEYTRSFQLIAIKQKGACWFCRQMVRFGEVFVSHGSRSTRYYHEGCARRAMLLY